MITNPGRRLPEFEHASSYWDSIHKISVVRILAGEYYVTRENEMISTVLGSCVAACIRDRILGLGGVNHFMLPAEADSMSRWGQAGMSADACYGNFAMEQLINCIIKYGGRRDNLEVKIFGGGRMMGGMVNIGLKNINFIRAYLQTEGLVINAEDVGGDFSRRLAYFPASGRVLIKKLPMVRDDALIQQETTYLNTIRSTAKGGDVELFGD